MLGSFGGLRRDQPVLLLVGAVVDEVFFSVVADDSVFEVSASNCV